jgi:hypothetical protein
VFVILHLFQSSIIDTLQIDNTNLEFLSVILYIKTQFIHCKLEIKKRKPVMLFIVTEILCFFSLLTLRFQAPFSWHCFNHILFPSGLPKEQGWRHILTKKRSVNHAFDLPHLVNLVWPTASAEFFFSKFTLLREPFD